MAWFVKWANQINAMLHQTRGSNSEDWNQWMERFHLQVLKIAGLLHLVRQRAGYAVSHLSHADLVAAAKIFRYYMVQFASVLKSIDGGDEETNVERLMAYAVKRQVPFTKADASRSVRTAGDTRRAQAVSDALAEAVSRGWLKKSGTKFTVVKKYIEQAK